ncbi:hypothetical protein ACFYN0_00925 [Streptomyces sp. NPDC006704]|uniref:hypothetical protein n=1 Tax=Streptomyces sp. NPDC006704 TaxID=3364760 RepID=UPI0036AAE4C3
MSWRILTSRITHDGHGNLSVTIRHRHSQGYVFYLSGLALPGGSTDREVYCPRCTADRGLTVAGAWGEDAELACPDGHRWTPRLPGLPPDRLLRAVVRQSLDGAGLRYSEARTDPEHKPPAPYNAAVRPALADAARALNRREWTFTEEEQLLAGELLRTSGWPATITWQEEATAAARLEWLRAGLAALHDCAGAAHGRLGKLLLACDSVLHTALALHIDDLEPGPDLRNPPVLVDAESALSGMRTVLVAGVTGDVDY